MIDLCLDRLLGLRHGVHLQPLTEEGPQDGKTKDFAPLGCTAFRMREEGSAIYKHNPARRFFEGFLDVSAEKRHGESNRQWTES